MNLTFVSGWAGYPQLYPTLAGQGTFILPFVDGSERAIVRQLGLGGDVLVAWSLGAHMVLKYWRAIEPHFGRIILAASFLDFTVFIPENVLPDMTSRFGMYPEGVVREYLDLCGCPRKAPFMAGDEKPLAEGLGYLMQSRAHPVHSGGHKVTLVHGQFDRIIPPEGSEDVLQHLSGAQFLALPCGHWIPEQNLLDLISQ